MATEPKGESQSGGSMLAPVRRWLEARGAAVLPKTPAPPILGGIQTLNPDSWDDQLADPVSLQSLGGTEQRLIRSRIGIYAKWQDMTADPVISTALRLHITSALGGHESKGEMVFIEATPEAKGAVEGADKPDKTAKPGKPPKPGKGKPDKLSADEELVRKIAEDLQPLFNNIAPQVCFNAAAFGDAYGRIYAEQGLGVRDVYTDELVYPPLVQPYERGNTTIGYTVATGSKFTEKLTVLQMARMRMPRTVYLPQNRVIEKALRTSIKTDKLEELPALPALAGGSFLDGAEVAYDKFSAAWIGLTGQRVRDSIDETMLTVNQVGMQPRQREILSRSLQSMFEKSNEYIRQVVNGGKSVYNRIVHFLPVSSDKQITSINGPPSQGRASSLTVDDVMMNARFLAGALGHDLSMLGFADQLSGGLGDGGFFRVSAQAAERARMIRAALSEFFDHIIQVHALLKYGRDFSGMKKPWVVSYYSGISALETERAKTKVDNMNSSALMVQTMEQLKGLGLDEAAMQQFMETEMGMDADEARMYAKCLVKAAKEAKAAEAAANGAGPGGGGSPFGGAPDVDPPEPGGTPGEPGDGGIVSAEG